ncbi:MAG: VOC family protein [Clostridia bacterium]|jgi:lactoylglutathione lyase|nr:VOC family protein [Clostridia bacterium]
MSFCWATITVKNLEESLSFYQDIVGLTVDRRFQAGPGMEIVFLGNGETKVELIGNKEVKEVNIGPHISLGFKVDSLDDKMEFVEEKGIPIQSGPFQPNPNTRFFFIQDPNGLTIQFVEVK